MPTPRWRKRGARRYPPKKLPASYIEYERQKAAWIAAHPGATPREYEQAMRAISKALCV